MSPPRIDRRWLRDHPLPGLANASDKNERGRVVVIGGAEFVPGALRLTGEAALRAGAGKVQLATVQSVATALGVLVPEASMLALPSDRNGEIAAQAVAMLEAHVGRCDAMVLGPGMSVSDRTDTLVARLLASPRQGLGVVLDAAALTSARDLAAVIASHEGRVIMTPHRGEMAIFAGMDEAAVAADPEGVAADMAGRFRSVILLKGQESILADPSGRLLRFDGGCVGLATAGSGDVLAGIIGGLLARGADPFRAAAWGCWLHGAAGRALSEEIGRIGFLARELAAIVPRLLDETMTAPQDG
ncbi:MULTISPECIES: NAD(P)H-hydrate dehydratase [Sphingobium]|jgi:ADP-dependent NAD(P)H-hydrate dehydratase|uniref:NAD(P)H-hydrate dehydratase n=1 Tax=Sphingobium TaxID=165695 RepID=UPI0010F945D1|nr:NAD(P)H-hydrate dehydratase [Sphingobium sp. RSMS]UXC93331.1 NAD(P)H-hydrate dehydratase [Sphingobium sp. RSMS]